MAVSRPKQRLRPRATLYSPPPSSTSKLRVVATRRSPGSKRNITSPRLTRAQRHDSFDLMESAISRKYQPAVDVDGRSIHERCFIGGEISDEGTDFGGLPLSPQRCHAGYPLADLRLVEFVVERLGDEARRHCID